MSMANCPEAEARPWLGIWPNASACRQTAEALRRSLDLAQVLWNDNLAVRSDAVRRCVAGILPAIRGRDALDTYSRCSYEHTTNLPRRRSFYAVAAAACILLATGGSFFAFCHRAPRQPPISFEEVQQQVARAGTAAELLAATRLVAQCEGTESIVEQQYRYILRDYADTPAAASIKADQNPKLGGTPND